MPASHFDRDGTRAEWDGARRAESSYNTRLRQVAKQVEWIVKGLAPEGVPRSLTALLNALEGYAVLIKPWADSVSRLMIADVSRRTERIWKTNSKEMSRALRVELAYSDQGRVFHELLDEQVGLIQSIPRKAAERVSHVVREGLLEGRRPESVAKEIMASGKVSQSKARLIARTEVSRTAATLMQARAIAAGSEGYIWRTSKDADVRDTHKAMEGKYVRWDTPPKTDPGLDPYHAGCGPNCRCFAVPVLPDL